MVGKYDTDNVAALRRLVAAGTELRPFSREILEAAYKASQEVYADFTAKNPKCKDGIRTLEGLHGRPAPVVPGQ